MKSLIIFILLLAAAPAQAIVQWTDPLNEATIQTATGGFIRYALGLIGVAGLAAFVYAGFSWMVAGGNPEKVTRAKDTLIWTTVGMTIIVASYAIVNFLVTRLQGAV